MTFPCRRILNPIDFDDNSMEAVEVAAGFARQNDGTVILLHVIPAFPITRGPLDDTTGGLPSHTIAEDQACAKLEEIARKHLQGVENQLQLLILLGNPAAAILGAAADFVADVVVMATHGRTGFSRAFFGSIAEEVLREAPCPVLTVHSSAPMFDHILLKR
jgi:nucleotide-binding universal stress UspA family protein